MTALDCILKKNDHDVKKIAWLQPPTWRLHVPQTMGKPSVCSAIQGTAYTHWPLANLNEILDM